MSGDNIFAIINTVLTTDPDLPLDATFFLKIKDLGIEPPNDPEYDRTVGLLIRGLENSNYKIRVNAALVLRFMREHSALDPLLKAVTDSSEEVRQQVVATLGSLKAKKAYEILIKLLYVEAENENMQAGIVWALGKIGDIRATPFLIPILNDKTKDQYLRMRTAEALGSLGDVTALEPLLEVFLDDVDPANNSAAEGLAGLGEPALKTLLGTLFSGTVDVRRRSANALALLGDGRAEEKLVQVINNKAESNLVRAASVQALGDIGAKRHVDFLLQLAENDTIEIRANAIVALGQSGDARAIPLLRFIEENETGKVDMVPLAGLAYDAIEKLS